MYTVQMISTVSCALKTACVVFENISHYRNDGQNVHSKDKGKGEEHADIVCQSTRCHLPQMTSSNVPKWICQMNPFMWGSPELFQTCPTLCDTLGCSSQTPLSMGFSRKELLSGLPYSPRGSSWPRDWACISTAQRADSLLLSHWGRPNPFIHNVTPIFPEWVEYS